MRTIIAGSRSIKDYQKVVVAVANCGWTPTIVISGTAKGVDKLGEKWANDNKVTIERYPADWDKYELEAGHIRNLYMGGIAEALIAVWDGVSSGTKDMIQIASVNQLKVYVSKHQYISLAT